jgi:hypothetical protein
LPPAARAWVNFALRVIETLDVERRSWVEAGLLSALRNAQSNQVNVECELCRRSSARSAGGRVADQKP